MSKTTLPLTDHLYQYLQGVSLREPPAFARCRRQTSELPLGGMQIAPEQGQLLHLLAKLMGAQRGIEVGSFTGYSALWLASALPPGGCLIACERNEEWAQMARRNWEEAGVMDRIDLRVGPALDTLDNLLFNEHAPGSMDFAFIDADKENYDSYYEQCLVLLRPGGLIAIDNVLWGGKVADLREEGPETQALRALNEKLLHDDRVEISLVPIGDGLTLARKLITRA